MCSRFHLTPYGRKILKDFPGYRDFQTGDIRPGDSSPVLAERENGLGLCTMLWGFHPDGKKENLFNARSESAETRYLFCPCFKERRCIVPASWFYEWNAEKEKIQLYPEEENALLYFAGLWRTEEDGEHFVVLTTKANESMRPVHDRMPLILEKDEIALWCGEEEEARKLLKKTPGRLKRTAEYEQLRLF